MEGGSIYAAFGMQQPQQQQTYQEESKVSVNYQGEQRLLILSSKGAQFFKMTPGSTPTESQLALDKNFPQYATSITGRFAPHKGHFAVIVDQMGIHFVDTRTGRESRFIDHYGVTAISISPRDTYLITCEKYSPGKNNLILWHTGSGTESAMFEWKKQSKEGPKSIKFSLDEKYCARLSSKTTIDLFEDGNFQNPRATITANASTLGKQGEKKPYWFDGVDFIPMQKDSGNGQTKPHFMIAWQNSEGLSENINEVGGNVYFFDLNSAINKPKFAVQCSKAQEIHVKSSPTGEAVLIWSQNYVDSTGKSYYGEHCLQYVQLVGGKARVFVPVFDGMIHDVKWSALGDYFIVISGTQPAVATLYDKLSNPKFEFGKRYRNTIRIDPFSNAAIIGGFGNLKGEIDIWNLDRHAEYGQTKSYCAVGIEWAPNGIHFMTAVLYERVKVDNEVKIFLANGQQVHSLDFKKDELNEVYWQPFEQGVLQKPNLATLGKIKEIKKEDAKPKRLWGQPGGSSVFSQIMRQEMSKTNEKGPKQVDKAQYKNLMNEQAQQHADFIANSKNDTYNPSQDSPVAREAWRKNFGSKEPYEQVQQLSSQMENDFAIEEQKLSKHAKRRAKKKQKIVVCEGNQQDQQQQQEDQ